MVNKISMMILCCHQQAKNNRPVLDWCLRRLHCGHQRSLCPPTVCRLFWGLVDAVWSEESRVSLGSFLRKPWSVDVSWSSPKKQWDGIHMHPIIHHSQKPLPSDGHSCGFKFHTSDTEQIAVSVFGFPSRLFAISVISLRLANREEH